MKAPADIRWMWRAAVWAGLLAAWILIVLVLRPADYVLPPPWDVAQALADNLGPLLASLWITVQEVLLGLALAVACAIPLAAAVQSLALFRRTVYPVMVAAQAAPKEALAPLLILWFGYNMLPRVLLAAIIAFFPIFVATAVGLQRFDRDLSFLAKTIGAGPIRTFFSLRVWRALPSFFSGLRLGITLATVGAVLGEFLGSDVGIGREVLVASRNLDGHVLYASLTLLVLASWALVGLSSLAERILLKGLRA